MSLTRFTGILVLALSLPAQTPTEAGVIRGRVVDAGGNPVKAARVYVLPDGPLSVIDALNEATSYTYDANGNRLTKTDANSHTTYTYDTLNRVRTRVLPAGGPLASR